MVDMLLDNDSCDLSKLSDEQLVMYCKEDESAFCVLLTRYAPIINYKVKAMTQNKSIDSDDLVQEGIIGLLNAVRTFDKNKQYKFSTYSNICISNKIKTAISKSVDCDILDDGLYEQSTDEDINPEKILIQKEKIKEIENDLSKVLSSYELKVFRFFLKGSAYSDMARQLHISLKAVDNAMQRVRRKLKLVWTTDHFLK